MTGLCSKTGKECRTEYQETAQGEEWERCMDCMESRFVRYHDVGSGGFTIVGALLLILGVTTFLLTDKAIYEALVLKIDSQVDRIETQLQEQDSTDPLQLIEARRLEKW